MWHLDLRTRQRGLASLARIWYGEGGGDEMERNLAGVAGVVAAVVLAVFVMVVATVVWTEVSEAMDDAWDGTFQCRPGETYTTKECP